MSTNQTVVENSNPEFKYFIFISYRRLDADWKAGVYFQRQLEKFRYPVSQVDESWRPSHPKYVRSVFRDRRNLKNTGNSFTEDIKQALTDSRYLLVLCSPNSAASPWVNDEIEYFLETHNHDLSLVIPVVLSGEPHLEGETCLPPALRLEAITSRNLPSMIPDPGDSEKTGWEAGLVQSLSYILHVDRERIKRSIDEEERRRRNVILSIISTALVICLCLTAWALYAERVATIAKQQAVSTLAMSDFQESARLIEATEDIPGALARLTGAFQEDFCVPAADRLYALLSQRSWLIERERVPEDKISEYVKNLDETPQEMLDWKILAVPKNSNSVTGQSVWECSVLSQNKDDASRKSVPSFEITAVMQPEIHVSPNAIYFYVLYPKESGDFYLESRSVKDASVIQSLNIGDMIPTFINQSRDGIHLVLSLDSQTPQKENQIWILDGYTLQLKQKIAVAENIAPQTVFSRDGRLLAVEAGGEWMRIYDVWNNVPVTERKSISDRVSKLVFSDNGRYVLCNSPQNSELGWRKYEIQASPLVSQIIKPEGGFNCGYVRFPNTQEVLTFSLIGSSDLYVSSFDFATKKSVRPEKLKISLNGKSGNCSLLGEPAVVPFKDGKRFAITANWEGNPYLIIFQKETNPENQEVQWVMQYMHQTPFLYSSMMLSPDERYLVLTDPPQNKAESSLYVFDLVNNNVRTEVTFSGWSTNAAFNADGTRFAVGGIEGAEFWSIQGETWKKMDFSQNPSLTKSLKKSVRQIKFSSRGDAALSYKGDLRVFDPDTQKILIERDNPVYGEHGSNVAFSPDGTKIAFAPTPKSVLVLNIDDNTPITSELVQSYIVQQIQLVEREGELLLICGTSGLGTNVQQGTIYEGKVELWNVASSRRISDQIPSNEKLILSEMIGNGLLYGTREALVFLPISSVLLPKTEEEKALLRQLLPMICQRYGDGVLNTWRAPQFQPISQKELDNFYVKHSDAISRSPSVKIWQTLNQWMETPWEKRTVSPESDVLMKDYLTQLAENSPDSCLNIAPDHAAAFINWNWSQFMKIAKEDYIFGTDNEKKLSDLTLQREKEWGEKSARLDFFTNQRANFFLDYTSAYGCELHPQNLQMLTNRMKRLQQLGKRQEAAEIGKKLSELLD